MQASGHLSHLGTHRKCSIEETIKLFPGAWKHSMENKKPAWDVQAKNLEGQILYGDKFGSGIVCHAVKPLPYEMGLEVKVF
jgi:hypothetical protein